MAATLRVARRATEALVPWLRALPQTIEVRNVEDVRRSGRSMWT
jgi:hypothetical protein